MKQLEFAGSEDWNTTLTFVGNATMIIRTAAGTLLTDPSFLHAGDHVHLGYGVRARRRLEPALQPADLPPLDAVLLSHLHGDHWDAPAERALSRSLPIITTMRAASALRCRGFGATHGLKTWQKLRCRKGEASLTITAVPAQHGPKAVAMLLPQTNGYTLDTLRGDGSPLRMYISGDTLLFAGLHEIPKRFPNIDVALLHLGGTRIPHAGFGVLVTLDAAGGLEAVRLLQPQTVVPIHTDDWSVFSSSLDDFRDGMRRAGLESQLRIVARGETIAL